MRWQAEAEAEDSEENEREKRRKSFIHRVEIEFISLQRWHPSSRCRSTVACDMTHSFSAASKESFFSRLFRFLQFSSDSRLFMLIHRQLAQRERERKAHKRQQQQSTWFLLFYDNIDCITQHDNDWRLLLWAEQNPLSWNYMKLWWWMSNSQKLSRVVVSIVVCWAHCEQEMCAESEHDEWLEKSRQSRLVDFYILSVSKSKGWTKWSRICMKRMFIRAVFFCCWFFFIWQFTAISSTRHIIVLVWIPCGGLRFLCEKHVLMSNL